MSHFSALVLSNFLDDALAPYNEQDETYYTPQDVTEDYTKDYNTHRKEGQTIDEFFEEWSGHEVVRSEVVAKRREAEKQHYVLVDENDNILKVVSFWNKDAKWDYWTEARDSWARWDYSSFIFKDPNFNPKENTITIGDIDLDAMVKRALDARRDEWNKVANIFDGKMPTITTWKEIAKPVQEEENKLKANWDTLNEEQKEIIREKCKAMWDKARSDYHNQPEVKAFQNSEVGGFWSNLDDYLKSREEFVDEATLPFHSIITDEGWFEPSEMGWWGITHDETMTPSEWRKKQIELFTSLPADTEVNLVDCHI